MACAASAAVATVGLAVSPAAAAPAGPAAAPAVSAEPEPGGACTAADLGTRHPYIKTTEVAPVITHFKGWYVTEGSTGTQKVTTTVQTVVKVTVGANASGNVEGAFPQLALTKAGATVGLNVQLEYTSTNTASTEVTWNFASPGYYGLYKGTKKVTGTYGSLNCNRAQQADGSWALKWVEGGGAGSFTTFTTLEEGAVRCEDAVPADSIMRKAQDLLDCGSAVATASHPAGEVTSAKAAEARKAEQAAAEQAVGARTAQAPANPAPAPLAALNCQAAVYKIDVPGKPLNWSAPLLPGDGIRLRESSFLSAHLDNWKLCNVTESNGVIEASLWNWGNGGCATVPSATANQELAVLTTASCVEDDLQRFYIYRDVPGSTKVGIQNKYSGSMAGHDRYADGEQIRQYSSGRQDGTGTYTMTVV